ncbi:MAG TPA: fibronectin type III domain-containing protein [Candidatus Sulfotelmatobacter sp.]|nr:fibronectin type III domain-containing protein [Candidatus Sulfotelmatobacter sp.]
MFIRFAISKPLSLFISLSLLISTAAIAQTNQNPTDGDNDQAAARASITQGPTIQYADDQFAVITWTTDQPFPSRVFYGKDPSNLNQVAEDTKSLSLRHQINLRNLQPSTTYYFRIDTGQGTAAVNSSDGVNGFQTTALGANPIRNQATFKGSLQPKPNPATGQTAQAANFGNIIVTRGPSIQYLDDTTAVISWTTNVPASNTLYYGTDRDNLLYTGGDFKDSTEHRIHLSNLKPRTRYYFQLDEPSSQPIASFTTVFAGAQPIYDQHPETISSGAAQNTGPQLSRREHAGQNELPEGTEVSASLETGLSTKTSSPGQRFTAAVTQPVRDFNDQIVIPVGARVNGQVTESEEGKNLPSVRGRGKLNLRFDSIDLPNGSTIPISATLLSVNQTGGNGSVNSEGEVQSNTNASTAAKGAAVGAGIGTIAGLIFGGPFKGLAIGAIAGGGYILATKGKDVELPANTELKIRLDQPVSLSQLTGRR